MVSKTFMFIYKFPRTTTAKIFPAHYFPKMILFKICNRINLSFGVILVAFELILLRKITLSCQLPLNFFENKKSLMLFAPKATVLKLIEIKKKSFFLAFSSQEPIPKDTDNRIFVKNIAYPVGHRNKYILNSVHKTIKS